MNKNRLEEIKARVMDISLVGWDCYHSNNEESNTIRFGNSFVDMPTDALYRIAFDEKSSRLIRFAPQDLMDLIQFAEGKL